MLPQLACIAPASARGALHVAYVLQRQFMHKLSVLHFSECLRRRLGACAPRLAPPSLSCLTLPFSLRPAYRIEVRSEGKRSHASLPLTLTPLPPLPPSSAWSLSRRMLCACCRCAATTTTPTVLRSGCPSTRHACGGGDGRGLRHWCPPFLSVCGGRAVLAAAAGRRRLRLGCPQSQDVCLSPSGAGLLHLQPRGAGGGQEGQQHSRGGGSRRRRRRRAGRAAAVAGAAAGCRMSIEHGNYTIRQLLDTVP